MAERENSVLFSLKELRNIEEDRVKQEDDARKSQIEAERRAKELAIKQAKEEEERKIVAEKDRLARLDQEKERQIREERLRVEESERKARVEAAARLEEARIQAEVQAAASAKKAPVGAIIGAVIGVVVLAGGVLGYVLGVYLPAKQAEQAAAAAVEQERAIKKALADQESKLDAEYTAKIEATKDQAEKDRLKAEMAAKRAQAEQNAAAARASVQHKAVAKPADKPKVKVGGEGNKCDPNDPLCGSGL
jgi:hypothetical protein